VIESSPLVTCLMLTCDRRRFVPLAIDCFLRQDYPNRELLIADDGRDAVADLVPFDARIRYVRLSSRLPVGSKRNAACELAAGDVILHWDDDDWSAPWRVSVQVRALLDGDADVCGLDRVLFYEPAADRAWEYAYPVGGRPWVHGATLCYRKEFWERHRFADIQIGEDTRFVWSSRGGRVRPLQDQRFFVGTIHRNNASPKQTTHARWRPRPASDIHALMGEASERYRRSAADPPVSGHPAALVSAARGVGDIVRITTLVRACAWLGYDVDVLLAPDYADAAALLRGAPEVRRVFLLPSPWNGSGATDTDGLEAELYDVATFTEWTESMRALVRARQTLVFDRAQWLRDGDSACVEAVAGQLGWDGPLPPPFAIPSRRRFGLPSGTVAIHPGCKPDWPWKKWHGFPDLAARLPHVAIVGASDDLDTRGTYFRHAFAWPRHAQNFIGQLDLPDTAALLQECAALVSNDSGLMQLGSALGLPTFGIFGITNPAREGMRVANLIPLSKGLPCEPACRRAPWGRQDCEFHLNCLRTLEAEEVLERIAAWSPDLVAAGPARHGRRGVTA
jgi:hypothetical protein